MPFSSLPFLGFTKDQIHNIRRWKQRSLSSFEADWWQQWRRIQVSWHQKSSRVIKSYSESSFEIFTVFPLSVGSISLFCPFVTLSLIFNRRRQVGLNEQRAGVHGSSRQLQPQREDRPPDQGGRGCHQLWLRLF